MEKVITNQGIIGGNEFSMEIFNTEQSVYEVIRMMDGVALFLEDHFHRLQKSMTMSGFLLDFGFEEFSRKTTELACLNRRSEGNIKFVYFVAREGFAWAFAFIPFSYPKSDEYAAGVATALLFAERENPNAKVIQNEVREKANQMIAEKKIYEVLLVDREGFITEGSRSNVFFVKDGTFYTAPASMVLEGITRQKVVQCINELGFHLVEQAVRASEISSYEAVFLTGTSPKVLPVKSVGNQMFSVENHLVVKLMEQYDNMITQYIQMAGKR